MRPKVRCSVWGECCEALSTGWECHQVGWCPPRSAPSLPAPHHTTTGLVTRGKEQHQFTTASAITATIVHGLFPRISNTLENGGSCCASHSPHPGSQNKGGKAFLRGWSPDTAALYTSQAGQRPLSWSLQILALTGLLSSWQHNAPCTREGPRSRPFPQREALKELHSLITELRREVCHHFKARADIPWRMGSAKTPKISSTRLDDGKHWGRQA